MPRAIGMLDVKRMRHGSYDLSHAERSIDVGTDVRPESGKKLTARS